MTEGLAVVVTLIKRFTIAFAAIAAAASLAGCATSPRPFSLEEKIWFDNATGYDILPVRPEPRYLPPGYGEYREIEWQR